MVTVVSEVTLHCCESFLNNNHRRLKRMAPYMRKDKPMSQVFDKETNVLQPRFFELHFALQTEGHNYMLEIKIIY